MDRLTCMCCRVVFCGPEQHRLHHKSDWHRYNLKRQLADLPPVTAQIFEEKVQEQKQKLISADIRQVFDCEACGKHFSSKNAHENHIKSKKHRESMELQLAKVKCDAESGPERALPDTVSSTKAPPKVYSPSSSSDACAEDDEDDWVDADEQNEDDKWDGEAIPPTTCLFCASENETLEDNLRHMTTVHSFFIPDVEYLTDVNGLVKYLGEKVGSGYVCLWCNERGKGFHSKQAVQRHMIDRGHCKIIFEGDALYEYSDFYDYSSSYPKEMVEGDPDEELPEAASEIVNDGYELTLPSGTVIGHRSLMRYYQQNLPEKRTSFGIERSTAIKAKLMSHYKALGWQHHMTGVVQAKKAADMKYLQKMRNKHFMKLGVKANKLQKYARPQVVF